MKKLLFVLGMLIIGLTSNLLQAQWVQMSNGMGNKDVQSLTYSETKIFAGTYYNGVYLSTDNGTNWTQTSLNNRDIRALAIIGNNVIAGTMNNGIYFSTNNGASWTQSNLISEDVWTLAVGGNNVFAGTDHTGVYISTNNGSSWSQTSMTNITVNSLFISGNNILAAAGVGGWGVFLSVNNGNSWTLIGDLDIGTYSVAASGNYIYAGPYYHGIYLSTDFGIHWNQTPLDNGTVVAIAVSGNNVFAGTEGFGFEVSNDNGVNWTHRSEGLGSAYINALCIIDNYIYAGTGNGVYKRPLSELTGIKQISNDVSQQFSLSQNYPNPFNPATSISFGLPSKLFVSLKIFDMLGNEVATIISEELSAGSYTTQWNAANLSSGIYFYRLQAGTFTETKKLVLHR